MTTTIPGVVTRPGSTPTGVPVTYLICEGCGWVQLHRADHRHACEQAQR